MGETPRWIDLRDPSAEDLRAHLPKDLHPTALAVLRAPLVHDDEPRPRIESHGDYVVGVLLVAVAVPSEDRVYYQEIDFILTADRLLTVTKTPADEHPFDTSAAREACHPDEPVSMSLFRLVDEIAERYLDLIDALNDEIDELEDHVEKWRAGMVRNRMSALRHDLLHIRRHLSPLRDAVHKIVDGRVELDQGDVFPREIELHFADTYDKLLRATEGLETSRELVAGVRDYFQAKIAHDQNDVMKRLTVIASLLLLPTFIVGLYGQNFPHMPELGWSFGYWWSWGVIVATTLGQLAWYRWRGWF